MGLGKNDESIHEKSLAGVVGDFLHQKKELVLL